MTVKKAALIFVIANIVLITIMESAPILLSQEYFTETGMIKPRYKQVVYWVLFLLGQLPALLLMLTMVGVGLNWSLKKATLVFVSTAIIFAICVPLARAQFPTHYLTDFGVIGVILKYIGLQLSTIFVMTPFIIFLSVIMQTGEDRKIPDYTGFRDLRIKKGPRWFVIIIATGLIVMFVSMAFIDPVHLVIKESKDVIFFGLIGGFYVYMLLGMIFMVIYRVRYDDTRIIATTVYFRQREHCWQDLQKIKTMYFSDGKRLIFKNTGTARIEEYLEGFDDLLKFAQEKLDNA
ncbi:hypothetical protein [Profundibacter sp.]